MDFDAIALGLTVYQQFSSNLSDLRASINHLNDTHADMAKKDDLNTKSTAMWATIKDVTAEGANLKTRTTLLESQLQKADEDRRELNREVRSLRERLHALEYRPAEAPKGKGNSINKADAD
ncbi:MAG TPA: hypothetical protein DDY78_01390 [Planctomycetales bacterium]|jgi:chromosome segregation ATPase|nr:hypothetical protein [Planctomycetales bacterium]